jgi:hypothetical protein
MDLMTATPANLAQKVDRLGYLLEYEVEAKPERIELSKLKSELQLHWEKHPADQAVRPQGSAYFVDLTARENWREITHKPKAFAALCAAMGMQKLFEAITSTFRLLVSAVPAEKQAAQEQRDA